MILMITAEKEGCSYNIPLKTSSELVLVSRGQLTVLKKAELNPKWEQLIQLNSTPEFPIYYDWADTVENAIHKFNSGEFPYNGETTPAEDDKEPMSEIPEASDELVLVSSQVDEEPVSEVDADQPEPDLKPEVEPELETEPEVEPEQEESLDVTPEAEEPTPEDSEESESKYTREYLQELSMTELREIGNEFNVKNRSFDGLLEEILEAQAKVS
ncbi:hypothetical protein [Vibrio phage Va2]|nr:hypothetical protein [Vibrio phage Va2]